jgi:sigma-E factor negative regulatory protein RseC
MSRDNTNIEQIGLVTEASGDYAKISVLGAGCSSCHNSLCMLGDSKAKEVTVKLNSLAVYPGEEVIVRINSSSGYKAVMWLYIIPFILMIGLLTTVGQLGYHESIAGLASLAILIPYFSVLYLFRKTLASQCRIDIAKR